MPEWVKFIGLFMREGIDTVDLDISPKASDLIDLSLLAIESGQKPNLELPQPIYLRNNVAQKSLK